MKILAWPAYPISEGNPYTKLLYTHLRELGATVDDFSMVRALSRRYDIFHLHWPEYYIGHRSRWKALAVTLMVFAAIYLQRVLGAKVFWTVHNLHSHNQTRPRMEAIFWRLFSSSVHGYFCLTNQGMKLARAKWEALRSVPGFIVPHGHYAGEYTNDVDGVQARRNLNLPQECKVLLFFGTIVSYKNVPALVSCFQQAFQDDTYLIIAGQGVCRREMDSIYALAAGNSRIRLDIRHIPQHEVQYYMRSADLVVLPFREILNSGSAILALSFGCPVLVPSVGAMAELQDIVGRDWVRLFDDELVPETLRASLEWATKPRGTTMPSLEQLGWKKIASSTLTAYTLAVAR
jgi:glycosyltransferase involved in cell wall biosynthesis